MGGAAGQHQQGGVPERDYPREQLQLSALYEDYVGQHSGQRKGNRDIRILRLSVLAVGSAVAEYEAREQLYLRPVYITDQCDVSGWSDGNQFLRLFQLWQAAGDFSAGFAGENQCGRIQLLRAA